MLAGLRVRPCDWDVPRDKFAAVIMKNVNWPPVARQNQFRETIAIQIAKNRAANQANLFERLRIHHIDLPLIPIVTKDPRRDRLRITPRDNTTPNKQFKFA